MYKYHHRQVIVLNKYETVNGVDACMIAGMLKAPIQPYQMT